MIEIIENFCQVTPDWLTRVLKNRGNLLQGKVTGIFPGEEKKTFASTVCRLEVRYSEDASPDVPKQLFLKTSDLSLAPGEFDPRQLNKEIEFYQVIAPEMEITFTIPCYDVRHNPQTGRSHLLLKDVSETHTAMPLPSSRQNCESAVDGLADLHAFWWDHPRLGNGIGEFPSPADRQKDWETTITCTDSFLSAVGNQMNSSWRDNYQRILKALPDLFQRHASRRNMTLVHGDAHLGNFLFPINMESDPTYLLDWQFWHPTIGGTDLAFLMATGWEVKTRRSLEQILLHRYYDRLTQKGVRGYGWEDCWNDYRLSVILVSIFIPVWQWAIFHWEANLDTVEKSMTAFEDLKCSELLNRHLA